MKIGIDGRLLVRNITGLERLIYNLVNHLDKIIPRDNEIYIYTSNSYKTELFYFNKINTRSIDLLFNDILNKRIKLFHMTYKPQTFEDVLDFIGTDYVFTLNDLIAYNFKYKRDESDFDYYRKVLKITLYGANRIIAISNHNKNDIIKNFKIDSNKIEVIYPGLDSKFVKISDDNILNDFRQTYSLPERYLLYLGTDYPHKNLKNLFLSFKQLINNKNFKDLYLVVAGESRYGKDYLVNEIEEIKDNLILLDHFPERNIVELYNGALAFIYPSLYEGFGFPPLEAMACGIPVIASKATSIPEVVGDAGLIVDAENIDELSKAMEKLLTDTELQEALIERGYERVKFFNWETTARKTLELYTNVILEKPNSLTHFKQSLFQLNKFLKENELLKERNLKINKLQKSINEKDKQLIDLEIKLQQILTSKGWKLLDVLRKFKIRWYLGPLSLIKMGFTSYKNNGLIATIKKVFLYLLHKNYMIRENTYYSWIKQNEPDKEELKKLKNNIVRFKLKPLISIIMPVYNVEKEWLDKAILSVVNQIYPYWELCVVDDASTEAHIKKSIERWKNRDTRIIVKYLEENKGISVASNEAISLSKGEYVGFLDHDDELAPNALYEVVKLLNEHPEADMIYSDEDKIDANERRLGPYFKPEWSPDLFLSHMYTCHFSVYRKEIVNKIDGFRQGYEGGQDYDLALRITEQTNSIFHIPKILYHWRMLKNSTALRAKSKDYAHISSYNAIKDAIERRGEKAVIERVKGLVGNYRVHYFTKTNSKVTIIIPTKDQVKILNRCLKSIFNTTNYENYEVLVIDNNSNESGTFKLFDYWKDKEPDKFRVERHKTPFNFSKINNYAAEIARGNLLLFLNNDVKIITENWLDEMVGQAERKSIGAVGTMLLYSNNTVQHAGVILGIGGVAGHAFRNFPASHTGFCGRMVVISNYSAVTAACMMVRREVFEDVGRFDEDLPIAFNDVDFCIKVREKGYYNVFLPHVRLYHYESSSRGYEDTPEKMKRYKRDVKYMQEKWGDLLLHDPFYSPNLTLKREDFSLKINEDRY